MDRIGRKDDSIGAGTNSAGSAGTGSHTMIVGDWAPPPPPPSFSQIQAPTIPQLVPPPPPPEPEPIYIPYSGGTYGGAAPVIMGIQNVLERGGTLPEIFGKHLVFPKLAANFITVPKGNDVWGRALFVVSVGPCVITECKIGDKKVEDFGGDVRLQIITGDDVDEQITLYTQDVTTTALSLNLPYNGYVQNVAGQQAVTLQVEIAFPNGLYDTDSTGKRSATTVNFDVEYKLTTDSTWTKVVTTTSGDPTLVATDNTPQAVKRTVAWSVAKGSYDVRIKRTTADSTSSTLVNTSQWTSLRAEGDTPQVRPYYDQAGNKVPITYIAAEFRSSEVLNGVLDQFNCVASRKLPVWNGTTWTAPQETSTPAWAYVQVLTGPCNPSPIQKSQVNTADMLDWAQYTDGLNRSFNYVYEQPSQTGDLLRIIATAGRASVHQRDGKWTAVIDRKQTTIIQHVTPFNVLKGTFKQNGTFPGDRVPHKLLVKFVDPNSKWQLNERYAYRDGYSEDGANGTQIARKEEDLVLPGCTNSDQAWRDGRYYIGRALKRRRKWTFMLDFEGYALDRGDLIRLAHPTALAGLYQGRIKAILTDVGGNITGIQLNANVTMETDKEYSVRIRCPEFDTYACVVTTTPGVTDTLVFAAPLSASATVKPAVGNVAQFGIKSLESFEAIIDSVQYHQDGAATFTAVDHAPDIFNVETEAVPPFTSGITVRSTIDTTVPQPVILSVRSDEEVLIKNPDESLSSRILLTMGPLDPIVKEYEPEFKPHDAQTWTALSAVPVGQGAVSIVGVQDGTTYDVRIRSRSRTDYLSSWVSVTHTVVGKLTPPPKVLVLDILPEGLLIWVYPNPPKDLAGFRIKYHLGSNDNWTSATVAADLVKGNQFDITSLPRGMMTLMIAAVDVAGNESEVQSLLRDFGDPPINNVLLTHSEAPTFTGIITGGTVSGGILEANDDGGLFWGSDDSQLFWGGDDTDLFWNSSFSELVYEFSYTPDYPLGSGIFMTLDTNIVGEGVKIEYRTPGSSLFWDDVDGSLFWSGSDSDLFWGEDEPWKPWPGKIEATFQKYEFRITCPASGTKRGTISQLDVVIDVPDVVEDVNNFEYDPATGTTRLPVTKSFREITNIQLTMEKNDSLYPTAKQARYLDKNILGPLVIVEDTTGGAVKGRLDATLKGY